MIKIKDIYKFLDTLCPFSSACDFDNAGLLIGDENAEVKKALVTLDCTLESVKKARELDCRLIITHHPVIFDPIKSVTAGSVIYELLRSDISVISCHTNLDQAEFGVNYELCRTLGLKNIKPFTASDGFVLMSANTVKPCSAFEFAKNAKAALNTSVRYVSSNREIKNVLVCSGSGGGYLSEAISSGFDAFLTADIKHNVFIDALNSGFPLFDAGQYQTENIIVRPLCEKLKREFSKTEFIPFDNADILFL